MKNRYKQLIVITLSIGVVSCSMNRMQCSGLDDIYIDTKETIPVLEGAPEISRGVFLSKYTDLLDHRVSSYLYSGSIPRKSDMTHPFCARVAKILTSPSPSDSNKEITLQNLKNDWLDKFEEKIQSVVRNNPTIPITECNHVVLPISEAYLRKIAGDPSGFYMIKPQYDECISLSLTTRQPSNSVEFKVKNEQ